MRHALCWLIALSWMMGDSSEAAEETGQSVTRIIIPDRETAAERHAANELIANIAMMTGQSVPVITESEAAENEISSTGRATGRRGTASML